MDTVFLDQMPQLFFFFLLHVSVRLLFEGGVYFFEKSANTNNSWIRYVRMIQ